MLRKPIEAIEERQRRRRGRTVRVAEVIEFLEYLAPPYLSRPDEPYGLQSGSNSAEVRSIIVTPLATFNAATLAASRKRSLLVTAAPLIREPLRSVRTDDGVGNRLSYLIEHCIGLYALANSFAAAPGGFDDSLAERLGLAASNALGEPSYEEQFKITVFTPIGTADHLLKAVTEAGAGLGRNFSHCSFQTEGVGTFLSEADGASIDSITRADEMRIELVAPRRELKSVVAAIIDANPYQEASYDVVPMRNPGAAYRRGRIGELPLAVSLDTVIAQVQDSVAPESIRVSHRPEYNVRMLAVASGIGQGLFWQAARASAGAFVTGGLGIEDLTLAHNSTTVALDIGFQASVLPGLERLAAQIRSTFAGDGVEVLLCP